MAILYQTTKFKSANILAIAIFGSTAKFNSHQYFRLYGNTDNILVQLVRIPAPGGKALEAVDEGRPHPLYDTFTKELPADVTEHHHDMPCPPSDGRSRIRETGEEWRPDVVDFWKESVLRQKIHVEINATVDRDIFTGKIFCL